MHNAATTSSPSTIKTAVIARRRAYDGTKVLLWSDGSVTGPLGYALKGVTLVRPRSKKAKSLALTAGWMFMGSVELYDVDELGAFYNACRWAAKNEKPVGDARALADARASLVPSWEVTRARRDGTPTQRVWRVSRLMVPTRLVVWDKCTGADRYSVWSDDGTGCCTSTGMTFGNMRDLSAYLDRHRA